MASSEAVENPDMMTDVEKITLSLIHLMGRYIRHESDGTARSVSYIERTQLFPLSATSAGGPPILNTLQILVHTIQSVKDMHNSVERQDRQWLVRLCARQGYRAECAMGHARLTSRMTRTEYSPADFTDNACCSLGLSHAHGQAVSSVITL